MKDRFNNDEWLLIHYILNNDKDDTWFNLAKKFNLRKDIKNDFSRGRAVNDIWRRFLRNLDREDLDLQTVKETYNEGRLVWETKKKVSNHTVNLEGNSNYELEKVSQSSNGLEWKSFKKKTFLQEDSFLEDLKNKLSGDITPIIVETLPQNEKGLFIYTSDKHIGAKTKSQSIYNNEYNEEKIRKRLGKTIQEMIYQKSIHGTFDSLFIFDLGDALDGFNGKTTGGLRGTSQHSLPQNMDNREQFDVYVRLHKDYFDTIVNLGLAENIYFKVTSNSNHGGSFEYTAMKALEIYLNLKYPFIKTDITDKFITYFKYGIHTFIYSHGKDDEDMKHGLPLNLNDKTINFISDYIDTYKLNGPIHFIKGDLHQSASQSIKKFRYKNVMSLYGSSKWMHTNFGPGVAGLDYDIVSKYQNRVSEESIKF